MKGSTWKLPKRYRFNKIKNPSSTTKMTHHLDFNRHIKVSKSLVDLVEAVIKVVYIDKNHSIDIVREIFKGLSDPMISLEILEYVHPMTKLYEMCQKINLKVKFMNSWKESITVNVLISDQIIRTGVYGL